MSKYGVISGPYFTVFRSEITPYLDTFYAVASLYFLTHKLHTFYKSSPKKGKFLDFPLLALKFTKFLMSFFGTRAQFFFKLYITFQCHET